MLKVIDVSAYQPNIDYAKVKAAGIDGVILRCGYTGWGSSHSLNTDKCFERHYAGFKAAGIPVGAYYYSTADTVEFAKKEAEYMLSLLRGKQFELPVYYDIENNERQAVLSMALLTEIADAFCSAMEDAGYFVGVYANTSWFMSKLDHAELAEKYTIWLADYRGDNANKTLKRDIWQHTSTGRVNGIEGNVDMDECYRDFPGIIKAAGLNGYSTPAPKPQPTATAIQKGAQVKVKSGAKDYNGSGLADHVYKTTYTVLEVSGDRVVIGLNGAVTAAIKTSNLIPSVTLNVGDTVKVTPNAPVYGGTAKFQPWVYSSAFYVREISDSRVVISTQKTGAVTGAVDKKYLTKV